MKVLIVGANGQLGRALQGAFAQEDLILWTRPEHDLSDPALAQRLAESRPDLVVNGAAWTNVDGAESEPDAAYAANTLGPLYLAQGCAACGATFVQVSTNEVFPGLPGQLYREYDQPNPAGGSELEGGSERVEEAARLRPSDGHDERHQGDDRDRHQHDDGGRIELGHGAISIAPREPTGLEEDLRSG